MAEAAAAAETKYHFDIKMTCSGCSGAIDRTLKKMEGMSLPPSPLSPFFALPPHGPSLPLSLQPSQHVHLYPHSRRQILRRFPRDPNRRHCRRAVVGVRDGARETQEDGQGYLGCDKGWGGHGGLRVRCGGDEDEMSRI
jgi:hypothetical protein